MSDIPDLIRQCTKPSDEVERRGLENEPGFKLKRRPLTSGLQHGVLIRKKKTMTYHPASQFPIVALVAQSISELSSFVDNLVGKIVSELNLNGER